MKKGREMERGNSNTIAHRMVVAGGSAMSLLDVPTAVRRRLVEFQIIDDQ